MKPRHTPLLPGRLNFDAQGTPASALYGDVYHGRAGALAQARHVFIAGNGLPDRWAGRATFTVCETGFGLGNNFLALWQAWRADWKRPQRLHMVSFEAHPLSHADLARALAGHAGELREMAQALLDAWPPGLPGLHRLEFEAGQVTLTLAFGQVQHMARQVEAGVDAFFLDGFAPDRNPAMWSRELFGQLTRIANQGATAATWCSAGQVRRDLAAAGFLVRREPGVGGKRQISCAVLRPGLGRPVPAPVSQEVLVVGGGFAGAGLAYSLALRGHGVTVLDPAFGLGAAGLHEGHRSAALTPMLSRDDNAMARLSRAGILLATTRWRGLPGVSETCGSLLRLPAREAQAWQQALQHWRFPPEWAGWCAPADTAARCGRSLSEGGLWLPQGRLVRPARLVATQLAAPGIRVRAERVAALRRHPAGWEALEASGRVLAQAPRVVLAAAAATPALLRTALPEMSCPKLNRMQLMGGQVAYFRAAGLPSTRAIVAGAGYWLPADEGIHVGGSTYIFDAPQCSTTETGFQAVAGKLADLLEIPPEPLMAARAEPDGWAGARVALSDHLPVLGAVDAEASLWLACGYGSRGLSWMTLAGEGMAAALSAEPQVLERELLKAVKPR